MSHRKNLSVLVFALLAMLPALATENIPLTFSLHDVKTSRVKIQMPEGWEIVSNEANYQNGWFTFADEHYVTLKNNESLQVCYLTCKKIGEYDAVDLEKFDAKYFSNSILKSVFKGAQIKNASSPVSTYTQSVQFDYEGKTLRAATAALYLENYCFRLFLCGPQNEEALEKDVHALMDQIEVVSLQP